MDFKLQDVLSTAAPTASLVFASWIFLQLLSQKHIASFERYRSLISEYRQDEEGGKRKDDLIEQIPLYKKRCENMQLAMNIGVTAAILLILTLLTATLHMTMQQVTFLKYLSVGLSVVGLLLLIVAACFAIGENLSLYKVLDVELKDIPELAQATGVQPTGAPREKHA